MEIEAPIRVNVDGYLVDRWGEKLSFAQGNDVAKVYNAARAKQSVNDELEVYVVSIHDTIVVVRVYPNGSRDEFPFAYTQVAISVNDVDSEGRAVWGEPTIESGMSVQWAKRQYASLFKVVEIAEKLEALTGKSWRESNVKEVLAGLGVPVTERSL